MLEGLYIEACRMKLNAEAVSKLYPDTKDLLMEPANALFEIADSAIRQVLREQDEAGEAVAMNSERMDAQAEWRGA